MSEKDEHGSCKDTIVVAISDIHGLHLRDDVLDIPDGTPADAQCSGGHTSNDCSYHTGGTNCSAANTFDALFQSTTGSSSLAVFQHVMLPLSKRPFPL